MSAKLLHSLTDENPDLQKQIGCMNGIFQLFDRHHFLSGRRIHRNQKRLPPAQGDNHGTKPNAASQPPQNEKNQRKAMKEKQRLSTESSRTSFSSSSCSSSFSSIDCNKQSLPESSLNGQTNFPGTPSPDLPLYQPNNSLQLGRQPVDIRDVVKDSMYREARELLIKTASKENAQGQTLKYMDSPRPLQQPKSVKCRGSGLNESFRVLSKLQEAPWSSNELKDSFTAKDAPRFSYDGRESREGLKSTIKLKELPRLSLDSRERSMRGSTTEMKSNYLPTDLQRGNGNSNSILNQQQEPGSNKRPSSVVAKLMGLEAFPDSTSTNENQPNQTKTFQDPECGSFSRLSRKTNENKQNQISSSSVNSIKEPLSPRVKNANAIKKPIASSKFPMEAAPWKQPDGSKGQIPALKCRETPTTAPNSLSVYGEIEKRLAQLEFKKSGKDLRALKQILEAMHKTKEILKSSKEDQASSFVSLTGMNNSVDQSSKLANSERLRSSDPTSTTVKGTSSPKSFRSPIVIVKASKSIKKASNCAFPAIQNESLSGLQRLRIVDSAASRKESVDNRTKDQTPRTNHLRDPSSRPFHPINKNVGTKSLRSVQTPKSSHPPPGNMRSGKSFEPMNPRQQQKELRLEKQSHSRTSSSDLSRSRGQPIESGSPRTKFRAKSSHLRQSSNQLSDISIDTRDLGHQGDAISLKSESYISMASNIDSEVTSTDRSNKSTGALFLQHDHKEPAVGYIEDGTMAEPARAGPEQPSPVSVLDATFYRDEPPSPVKKISHAFKDDEALNSEDAEWSLMNLNHLSRCGKPGFSSEHDNKLENTRYLDQNNMQINPTHEESIINGTASIYDSTDQNHRYISEILLASGLLKDFESDFLPMQLHPSAHLINPNLFFGLEQTKASTGLSNDEYEAKKISRPESTTEKAQRKLVFDAVNEILVQKLVLQESSKKWFSPSKLANKQYSGQKLLRDVCSEVDCLQANNSDCNLDDEYDSLGGIIREDLMHGSMDWTDCQNEIPGLVLDVERMIFKDLINEILRDQMASVRGHPGRHCRQLFSK